MNGMLIIIGVILLVFSPLLYIMQVEPWIVSNEIKDRIKIIEPYDEYKSMFCWHDAYDWWNVILSVFDIESGNSTYSALHYNRNTGELKGTFRGIESLT